MIRFCIGYAYWIFAFVTLVEAEVESVNDNEHFFDPTIANPFNISWSQFSEAVTANGFRAPRTRNYNRFVNRPARIGGVTSKAEMAMLMAHLLHESGGFRYSAEIGCPSDAHCSKSQYASWNPNTCGVNRAIPCNQGPWPGKLYFGRGFLQISWPVNYDAASWFLFQDDRLWKTPDSVASSNLMSWDTALWYWRAAVHDYPGVTQGHFGASTRAINGQLECSGSGT
jgi:hypothetical protein